MKVPFRPYARLLTLLGDQLIRNEQIALVELVKNSYDADATTVVIDFHNFDEDFCATSKSSIRIRDDGDGMSEDILQNVWMRPATDHKVTLRKLGETDRGRTLQGEKGIGRFAALKLGKKLKIISRTRDSNIETTLTLDLSDFDDNFSGPEGGLWLDAIEAEITTHSVSTFKKGATWEVNGGLVEWPEHGTEIVISYIRGEWSQNKVNQVHSDLKKLQPLFGTIETDFEVLFRTPTVLDLDHEYDGKIRALLEMRPVLRVLNGKFDPSGDFSCEISGKPTKFSVFDATKIKGIEAFKERFGGLSETEIKKRIRSVGGFEFEFYVFDFSAQAPVRYKLDKDDKDILRPHRVYLYRDGIRVYPYGNADDDWLGVDSSRGTKSAGSYLSNDQVVGVVKITKQGNPKLSDKTNREGLVDSGETTRDFVVLLQSFLRHLRKGPYARYKTKESQKNEAEIFRTNQVETLFGELKSHLSGEKKKLVRKTEKLYKKEKQFLIARAEKTEELAGVGLSVETASHDIFAVLARVNSNLNELINYASRQSIPRKELQNKLESIRGGLAFVMDSLKNVQSLFTASKQRKKQIRVGNSFEKIASIYSRVLEDSGVDLDIVVRGSPLIAKTTEAVLLQLFVNLLDNALYWLAVESPAEPQILVQLDGDLGLLTFADNGCGVDEDDAAYIFEAFYSGKGQEGRGLGLYIARQLLNRAGYNIRLAQGNRERLLSGANFVIDFNEGS